MVITASFDEDGFIAVTVPVNLGNSVDAALYSSGKNINKGKDAQQKKGVVLGVYAAVETVKRDRKMGEVEWIMATASDAKGNLPMWVQRMSLPGAVVKDVSYFTKWIREVSEEEMARQEPGTATGS